MNASPCFQPRRVSLVELLIAVTIVGLLFSILIPAFKRASADADLARCRSNLHEVGAAMHFYAADHDGRLPPVPGNHSTAYAAVRISDISARGVANLVGAPIGYGDNSGYLKSWSPLFCPSQQSYIVPEPGERASSIGYLGIFIHPDTANSWFSRNNWTNESFHSNPLMPVLYDFGQGTIFNPWHLVSIPAHPTVSNDSNKRSGFINVLHAGGHVSTRSVEEADMHTTLGALMRYLGTGEVNNSL